MCVFVLKFLDDRNPLVEVLSYCQCRTGIKRPGGWGVLKGNDRNAPKPPFVVHFCKLISADILKKFQCRRNLGSSGRGCWEGKAGIETICQCTICRLTEAGVYF